MRPLKHLLLLRGRRAASDGVPSATAFFDKLTATVPFDRLAASVAGVSAAGDAAGAGGRPHWPVVTGSPSTPLRVT